ncbi:MAG: hypothetical protein BWY70_00898 [Bacteroidetes bacterium ADurb.Bin408]|nr:MAG: hypothetical protein BWY70_00898 [Bacteroidetes bacterium ADurb.Bin408]
MAEKFKLSEIDRKQILEKGISDDIIEQQLEIFRQGIPYLKLAAAATPENGIKVFDEAEIEHLCATYEKATADINVLKFVPASGAASRMFKDMFTLKENYEKGKIDEKSAFKIKNFFQELPHFAFYNELKKIMTTAGEDFDKALITQDYATIAGFILGEKGLNYASTPKALIKFHNYGDEVRTSLEEHLVEGALFCRNAKGETHLHFTLSPEHKQAVIGLLDKVVPTYSARYNTTYHISYTEQKPSTDTIAVDLANEPFREADGKLLFRPAGHGALIENLNDCKEALIFIKNIDNIVPDRLRGETIRYKKMIGGLLLKLKDKVAHYLQLFEQGQPIDSVLYEAADFAKEELFISIADALYNNPQNLFAFLKSKFNRPLRVCGMVVNAGEPGGGPFWVENPSDKSLSLQIVESSQVDMKNEQQKDILMHATHFNPVDLVCWVYDYKGNKFNLTQFVDPNTGFISQKSKDGRELKALELPGLWNGAMANWITVFVDVPLITFNPVKTIDDLLRKEHCALTQ